MYIQGRSKEYFTARANQGKGNSMVIIGVIIFLMALAFFMLEVVMINRASKADKSTLGIAMTIMGVVLLDTGVSTLMNGIAFKSAKLIVYDDGIYGTAAKINPLLGILSKTVAFDIPFQEITGVRVENRALLINRNSEEYTFAFSPSENHNIQQLIIRGKQ